MFENARGGPERKGTELSRYLIHLTTSLFSYTFLLSYLSSVYGGSDHYCLPAERWRTKRHDRRYLSAKEESKRRVINLGRQSNPTEPCLGCTYKEWGLCHIRSWRLRVENAIPIGWKLKLREYACFLSSTGDPLLSFRRVCLFRTIRSELFGSF